MDLLSWFRNKSAPKQRHLSAGEAHTAATNLYNNLSASGCPNCVGTILLAALAMLIQAAPDRKEFNRRKGVVLNYLQQVPDKSASRN
jgi:hypothetical protein